MYLGVELEEKAGHHDGKPAGSKKRYFECRAGYGFMDLALRFKKVAGKTGGPSTPGGAAAKNINESIKKATGGSNAGKSTPVVIDSSSMDTSKSKKDAMTQTDEKGGETGAESGSNPISESSSSAAAMFQAHQQKLRQEIDGLYGQLKEKELKMQEMEDRVTEAEEVVERLSLEKEDMAVELRKVKDEAETWKCRYELCELELEETKEEQQVLKETFVADLANLNEKEAAYILLENETLKQSLQKLRQAVLQQIEKRNEDMLKLEMDNKKLVPLEEKVKKLESTEKELRQCQLIVEDLKHQIDSYADLQDMVVQLTEKNLDFEQQMQKLNTQLRSAQDLIDVLQRMDAENDRYVVDMREELTDVSQRLDHTTQELEKEKKAHTKSQELMLELKKHILRLEEAAAANAASANAAAAAAAAAA
ncbi:dynactin, partial [Reticulomyxa filosa]